MKNNRHCYTTDKPEKYLLDAFPDKVLGYDAWLRLLERLSDLVEPQPDRRAEDPLLELRARHAERDQKLQLTCPRVFISHRRCDVDEALRIAWLANSNKFDYWLDILDPKLAAASLGRNLTAYQLAVLMAAIIEMALLNCSHVIAVMTKNVRGTLWMPYEYGRVKDSQLISLETAAWFDRNWGLLNTPEYFHLGCKLKNEADINAWFALFRQSASALCPTKPWPLNYLPKPLPN